MDKLTAILALTISVSGTLAADKPDYGDSTLKYYASRSDQIVVAEVLSEEVVGAATASGQVIYDFKVIVKDVVKGEMKNDEQLSVRAIRWDLHESQRALPVLKKGTMLILFLSKDNKSVDQWFGIQPFNSWMVSRLKGIITEESKTSLNKASEAVVIKENNSLK
jgi:hypothetical protein